MEENPACRLTGEHLSEPCQLQVTIDMVPDLALIEIFDFYLAGLAEYDICQESRDAWIILAHVCRKWRDIVFGSLRRLNIGLFLRAPRSVETMLDTWPPLPIHISGRRSQLTHWGVDNIVAALELNDRIHKIEIMDSSIIHVERLLAAMQKSFPSLTELDVSFLREATPVVIPNLFLNGSAPLLRSLRLRSVQFPLPALRNLLLSATDLVEIHIRKIPDPGLISPDAVVACLSVLTRLEELELGFCRSLRYSGSRHQPPLTRCVLPALTSLRFNGPLEYLEHLIAPIDSPLVDDLDVVLFHQPVLDTPQLAQFVDRTPKLKAPDEAHVYVDSSNVFVSLQWTHCRGLHFRITGMLSDQFSVVLQLCTSSFLRSFIPMVNRLYILDDDMLFMSHQNNVGSSQWLDLFRPFTTVEDLYLSLEISRPIVPVLHGIIGEGMTEVLPSLRNLFFESHSPPGPLEEAIGQFVAAVHLSNYPIAVSQWCRGDDPVWQYDD